MHNLSNIRFLAGLRTTSRRLFSFPVQACNEGNRIKLPINRPSIPPAASAAGYL